MNLYRDESGNPKYDAQRNLSGRTHYVDDDTLRFHKSRILSTRVADSGLLFALVESVALDMNNTRRGYRYAIFDLFGTILERPDLDQAFKSSKQAAKAMWTELNKIDAKAHTLKAIDEQQRRYIEEMDALRAKVADL